MLRIGIVIAIAMLVAESVSAETPSSLNVGVVYREAPSGHRMLRGIEEAFQENPGKRKIAIHQFSYPYEDAGLRIFRNVIRENNVDVILGPTDSGVFKDLQEFEDDVDSNGIVIFSPLVTADVGNDQKGWLFRANVPVTERARKIYDDLDTRGFDTLAVVYEATSFGEAAEIAFRGELTQDQESTYLSWRYQKPEDIRNAVKRIEIARPSAVGLFGSREHMDKLGRSLNDVSHGLTPYNPLLFTVVDASTLCMDDVFFVSLSKSKHEKSEGVRLATELEPVQCDLPPGEASDELKDLGYDTALHLLRVAESVDGDPATPGWREGFRDALVASMMKPRSPLPRTNMRFSGMQNLAAPAVRTYKNGFIETVDNDEIEWLQSRLDVRHRRFGLAPLFNLGLIVGIVTFLSFLDVGKSHTGSWMRFAWRWTFLRLVLFNVGVACAVFFFLAEFGEARWDNTLVAVSVAFGYAMLLKATIFETRAGQAIGFAHIYERILKNINRKLMVLRYELEGPRVYFLSYTNSKSWLKQVLERVYNESEEPHRAGERIEKVEKEVDAANTEIEKRRIYARTLLDLMNWRQIVRARLVPSTMREYELYDPSSLLREAAEYCTNKCPENRARIQALVNQHLTRLKKRSAKEHAVAKKELESRLADATSERGRVYFRLDWLVVRQVISIGDIWSQGFVEKDFTPLNARSQFRRWLGDLLHRWSKRTPVETRERRNTRRVPAEGEVLLTAQQADGESNTEYEGRLDDVSSGGASVTVSEDMATGTTDGQFNLAIRSGPLAGVMSAIDCCDFESIDGGTRLHLKWADLTQTTIDAITAYVSPAAVSGT